MFAPGVNFAICLSSWPQKKLAQNLVITSWDYSNRALYLMSSFWENFETLLLLLYSNNHWISESIISKIKEQKSVLLLRYAEEMWGVH